MAKLQTGLMGPFSGKLGPAVGFTWKGRACVRSYCRHIRDARTPAQLEQRSRFTAMIRFAQQSVHALRLGFRPLGDRLQITEGNCFTKRNTSRFRMEGGVLQVDYSRLTLSEGTLTGVLFATPVFDAESGVSVDYQANATARHASPHDAVYLYAYCPDLAEGRLMPAAERGDAHIDLDLPCTWRGLDVHLYGFTVGRHGDPSPTQYLGQGTVGTPTLQAPIPRPALPEQPDSQSTADTSRPVGTPSMATDASSVNPSDTPSPQPSAQLSLWDLLSAPPNP